MTKLGNKKTVKSLSITRWSCRSDACKSYCQSRSECLSALHDIYQNNIEKPITRSEAEGLYKYFQTLDSCFLAIFWNDVMDRFNAVSQALQSQSANLSDVVKLYKSLENFISEMRDEQTFQNYENKAKDLSGLQEYTFDYANSRIRKRKTFHDENTSNEIVLSGSDYMRVKVFYFILDNLLIN